MHSWAKTARQIHADEMFVRYHRPDAGEVLLDGQKFNSPMPNRRSESGVAMVHQTQSVRQAWIVDNIWLGRFLKGLVHRRRKAYQDTKEILNGYSTIRTIQSRRSVGIRDADGGNCQSGSYHSKYLNAATSSWLRKWRICSASSTHSKERGVGIILSHKMEEF